jgi:prolyl 4-hydroxylase
MTETECQNVIYLAQERLNVSAVIAPTGVGSAISNHRSSYDVSFGLGESELISILDDRIAHVCNWDAKKSTGWQVIRYRSHEYFAPHFDFLPPELVEASGGTQRVASVIVYLNDVEVGGTTVFPDAGMTIVPELGTALFFSYKSPRRASMTYHAGSAPLSGEKWIAVKWFTL